MLRHCDGQEDQTYIIHLVCASQKILTNKIMTDQVVENTNIISAVRSTEHMRLNNTNNIQNQSQHNNNNNNNNNNNVAMQHTSAQLYSTQYFDPRNSQQMAWMQQAYNHYFTQYMQL